MTDISAAVDAMQNGLTAAVHDCVRARAERDVSYHRRPHSRKAFRSARRALVMTVLAKCGNKHRAHAYVRLFPHGYGIPKRKGYKRMVEIGRVLMAGLEKETAREDGVVDA